MNPQIDPQTLARARPWTWLSGIKGAFQGGVDEATPLQQPLRTLPRFRLGEGWGLDKEVYWPERDPRMVYSRATSPADQGLLAERLAAPGGATELIRLIDRLTRFRTSR